MPHLDCRIHTTPDATSRAQVLQRDAHRYYELLAIGLREVRAAGFTVGELSAICDVLNGTLILWELDAGDGPRPRMTPESVATAITAELVDAARLAGLGEKWGIDPVGLARRLREDLTPLAVWALVDAVERSPRLHSASTEDLLREVGLL